MFKKILCVDDDPITLMILKMTMKKCEFTSIVETVADGTEAVRYYEGLLQNPSIDAPELIFLDLNMPQMSGWAFLDVFIARFQKYFPATKVIILSSSIDPEDIRKSQAAPCVKEFISKPIHTTTLLRLKSEIEVH
ncbi:response regulator [Cellulophaga sp. BC115SP]|uniref:response regulator n=1 Tax=Cellulophaga sp. BC115SP TaxID=2683263 RepID=UPI0014137049|nr:response regulator [Cellulophaga sp. BC115SP]NBB28944.1 response regulator [Cellulophaga sp. BC115SP]